MLILALLAAATAPQAGVVRVHKDWVAGCDNERTCTAMGLVPDSGNRAAYSVMVVSRGGAPDAVADISVLTETLEGWVETDDDTIQLWLEADGKMVNIKPDGSIAKDDVPLTVSLLQSARRIKVTGLPEHDFGFISLEGASAMLRYMDEAQGRAGTVNALVAKGPEAANSVVPAPVLPVIARPPASTRAPLAEDKALLLAKRRKLFCAGAEDADYIQTHRLDSRHSLVLVQRPCGSGAYNLVYHALIARDDQATVTLQDARFDADDLISENRTAARRFNLWWDQNRHLLESDFRGRAIGDCGTRQSFAWDGSRFRLIEQSSMPRCAGSGDFITTWRAEVR